MSISNCRSIFPLVKGCVYDVVDIYGMVSWKGVYLGRVGLFEQLSSPEYYYRDKWYHLFEKAKSEKGTYRFAAVEPEFSRKTGECHTLRVVRYGDRIETLFVDYNQPRCALLGDDVLESTRTFPESLYYPTTANRNSGSYAPTIDSDVEDDE